MQGQSLYINELQNPRYSITTLCNDVIFQVTTSSVVAGSHLETTEVNLTYDDLNHLLQTHLGLAGDIAEPAPSATQQLRNHKSALTGFLASVGKTTDARVGIEMTTRFDESLQTYLDLLDVADCTKRDRRSYLHRYRDLFAAHRNEALKPRRKTTTLSEALREAIAKKGVAPKTLAKAVGVSTSAIQRYLAGAVPNRRGIPGLHRLENALGLDRDSLTSLVKDSDEPAIADAPENQAFRSQQALRSADPYFLPVAAISEIFEREWRQFLTYKTTVTPGLERTAKGVWRCIPANTTPIDSPLAKVGNTVCPSAALALERIRGLLGYLARPLEMGGQGIPLESAQTLAWLAVPWATNGYMDFLTQRSDGLVHGGQQYFAGFVSSLVRPKTGYLRQRPEMRYRLPENVRPETPEGWERLCDEAYKAARLWIQHAKDLSRRPDAPIASLLAQESPLQPVMAAVGSIEQLAAHARPGSLSQARHKRDALLLAFVISNPLRLRTLQSLTWSADNSGSVYRTPGGWRVRLSRSMLKNGASKAGTRYDVAIAAWVGDMIDEYVEEHRGTLLGDSESTYFFVNNREGKPWAQMSVHAHGLTRRHVRGTHGFSLHAFRHLVATDLLKRNPNAVITAATLLNDSLETVMRSYAHLQRDDSFVAHHQHLETLRNKGTAK